MGDKKMEQLIKSFVLIILLCPYLLFPKYSISSQLNNVEDNTIDTFPSNIDNEALQDKDLIPGIDLEKYQDSKFIYEKYDSSLHRLNIIQD